MWKLFVSVLFVLCVGSVPTDNQKKIFENYEKHLLRLKDKLERKLSAPKKITNGLWDTVYLDESGNVVEDWTATGEEDRTETEPPKATIPFPTQTIGILQPPVSRTPPHIPKRFMAEQYHSYVQKAAGVFTTTPNAAADSQNPFSFVNLVPASVSVDEKNVEEKSAETKTESPKPTHMASPSVEKKRSDLQPLRDSLPIKRLKEKGNSIEDEEMEELPFLHKPDLFVSTTTTMLPLKSFVTASPDVLFSSSFASSSSEQSREQRIHRRFIPPMPTQWPPKKASTIVESPLTEADLGHFEGFQWPIPRRTLLDHDDSSFEDYDSDDLTLLTRRFGRKSNFRRKPSTMFARDYDYYYPRRRLNHRFPSLSGRQRPIPLPMAASSSEEETFERTESVVQPTENPVRLSTIRSGLTSDRDSAESIRKSAPSPQQRIVSPPNDQKRSDLQMSAENCKKVEMYAAMFSVRSPQSWVRHNCAFVQAFVPAPCNDIFAFVDSCYNRH